MDLEASRDALERLWREHRATPFHHMVTRQLDPTTDLALLEGYVAGLVSRWPVSRRGRHGGMPGPTPVEHRVALSAGVPPRLQRDLGRREHRAHLRFGRREIRSAQAGEDGDVGPWLRLPDGYEDIERLVSDDA